MTSGTTSTSWLYAVNLDVEMQRPPRVAVILVNYKDYAQRFLAPCYESLRAQSYSKEQITLFIVDNASTDQTQSILKRLAPDARILPNAENLGWAGGNNVAIRLALQEGFDYMVSLNMDTVLDQDWLKNLVEEAERKQEIHILQSKILLHGTDKINSLGNRIQFLGYGYCNGYGEKISSSTGPYSIDFASGASMMVKREVFERVGLFREEYFLYGDDLEFCWRARLAGYRIGLVEKSICYHKYNFRSILNALFYVERNRLLTLLTLEKWGTLLLVLPGLLLFQIGACIYFSLHGKGRVMMQVIRYFLQPRAWKFIRDRRREIRLLRTQRDAQIVRGFSGRIVFAEIRSVPFHLLVNPLLWLYWNVVRLFIVW